MFGRRQTVEMRGNEVWYRGRKVGYTAESGGALILIETLGPLILKWILAYLQERKGKRPEKIEAHVDGQVTEVADPGAQLPRAAKKSAAFSKKRRRGVSLGLVVLAVLALLVMAVACLASEPRTAAEPADLPPALQPWEVPALPAGQVQSPIRWPSDLPHPGPLAMTRVARPVRAVLITPEPGVPHCERSSAWTPCPRPRR